MESSISKSQQSFEVIANFFGITLQYRPVVDLLERLKDLAELAAKHADELPEMPELLDQKLINLALQYMREKGLQRKGAGRGGNPAAGMLEKSPLASALMQSADHHCKAIYDGLCFLLIVHSSQTIKPIGGHEAADEIRLSARAVDPRNTLLSKMPAWGMATGDYLSAIQNKIKSLATDCVAENQPKLLRVLENLASLKRKKTSSYRDKNRFTNAITESITHFNSEEEEVPQGQITKLFEFSNEAEEPPHVAVVFESDTEAAHEPIIFDVATRKAKSWVQRTELLSKVNTTRLNDIEKKLFVTKLHQQLEKCFAESVTGFAIGLIYLVGLNLDQVFNTRWGATGFINLKGQLKKVFPKPPILFKSDHADLQPQICLLTLPKLLVSWLEKHSTKLIGSDTLLLASKMSEADFTAEVQNTLDSWRDNSRYRFKISKLSAALSCELTYQTRNPLLITTISGDLKAEPPVLMFYQHLTQAKCQEAYQLATNALLDIHEDLFGGYFSSKTKTPEKVVNFIQGISADLKGSLKKFPASSINNHNRLMHYTLAMLLFATGHRPVQDPFCYWCDFDINDNGVLISDKVISSRHEYRYQILPKLVREQLLAYRRHLRQLAARLYRDKSLKRQQLGMKIIYSLNSQQQLLPAFFEIDEINFKFRSVRQKDIQDYWHQFADISANAGRSMICQLLTDKGVSPGLIELYLGHINGLSHRHGPRAGHAPLDDFKVLEEEVSSAMKTLGWKFIKIYETDRERVKLPKTFKKQVLTAQQQGLALGREKRRLKRLEQENQIKQIVAAARNKIFGEKRNHLSHEQRTDFLDTVKNNCYASGLSIQAGNTLATRWLNRVGQSGVSLAAYKAVRYLSAESSVISLHVFRNWQQCQLLQKSLLAAFSKRVNPETVEQFLVELITVAAVFGGLAKPELLKMLPEQIFTDTYRTDKETMLVEFESLRWLPDTLSMSRILFIHKHYTGEKVITALAGLDKHLSQYLNKNGFACTRDNVYSKLADLAQSLNTYHIPGALHGYWNAKSEGRHLPMHRLASFLTNKQYRPIETNEKITGVDAPIWLPAINNQNANFLSGTMVLNDVNAIFSEIEKTLPKGADKRDRALKTKLSKQLRLYTQQDNISPTSQILIAWLVERCRKGFSKERLAFSTIRRYATEIINPILALANNDLRIMDEDEFEELYLGCIELFSCNKSYRLGRLYDFHKFLQTELSVPSIHWSALFSMAGAQDIISNVDANLLTIQEYDRAIDLINNEHSINSWLKARYIVLLLLGYRFGLRFGEAFKLRAIDVQSDDHKVFLQLRGSVYGGLKTRAGVRQIPLIGHYSEQENSAWHVVTTQATHLIAKDHQTLLLCDDNASRESIHRLEAQRYLNQLLKHVSGDDSLHYHHLRHGFANRLMAYAYSWKDPLWQQISHRLIGRFGTQYLPQLWSSQDEPTVKLQSIADVLGHTSIRTTVSSYFHFPEVLGRAFYNRNQPDISAKIMAYLLGQPESTIQKRRERAKGKKVLQASLAGEPVKKLFPVLTTKLRPAIREVWRYKASQKKQPITPGLIDSILVQSARMRHVAQLHSNNFSPDIVEKVQKTAAIAQTNTRFGFYDVPVLDPDKIGGYVSDGNRVFEENVLEARRLSKLFFMIDKTMADKAYFDDESLAKFLQLDFATWRGNRRYDNCWWFTRVSSLSAFAELMAFLPLKEARFKLIHPQAILLPEDLHVQLRDHPAQFEISGDEQLLNGMVLKIVSLPLEWKTAQTFNRVFFCLLICCTLKVVESN